MSEERKRQTFKTREEQEKDTAPQDEPMAAQPAPEPEPKPEEE